MNRRKTAFLLTLFLLCTLLPSCGASTYESSSEDYYEENSRNVYDYCITTDEARDHMGEEVDVAGCVVSWADPGGDNPLFINLDYDYPDENRLQVVMWGETRDDYYDYLNSLLGKTIVVHGVLENYNGVAQITFDDESYMEEASEFLDSIQ